MYEWESLYENTYSAYMRQNFMKEFFVKSSRVIVDDEDFDKVSKWRWSIHRQGYVFRMKYAGGGKYNEKHEIVYLHRFILSSREGQIVDHINRNKLDNRKSNLRYSTKSENCANKGKNKNNTSGYKGVIFMDVTSVNKWRAMIGVHGKRRIHLGCFPSPVEAAIAYNEAAKKYFGKFAYQNEV